MLDNVIGKRLGRKILLIVVGENAYSRGNLILDSPNGEGNKLRAQTNYLLLFSQTVRTFILLL